MIPLVYTYHSSIYTSSGTARGLLQYGTLFSYSLSYIYMFIHVLS